MSDGIDREQLRLGDFVAKLAAVTAHHGDHIAFDFCGLVPTNFDSYRGFYDQIALGFLDPYQSVSNLRQTREEWPEPTVGTLLTRAKAAVGAVYEGYKGGSYLMSERTPLWVANYGQCHSTAVVGVREKYGEVIIETARID